MSNTEPNLSETLKQAWDLIGQSGTTRTGVLANLVDGGAPQARSVIVRGGDQEKGIIAIHSDLFSSKISELATDPRVSLLIWMPEELVQLRLSGTVRIVTGEEVSPLWEQTPDAERRDYGHLPPPGTIIADPDHWTITPTQDRFAVLEILLDHIDAVCLNPAGHRRAAFTRSNNWQGQWLTP